MWQALDGVSVQACAAIRLLLLLGQREMEVVGMRWADLDLDGALWSQPPERTKAGRAVLVPLPPAAVDILRALPRKSPDQPTVFVGKPRGAQGGRQTRSIVAHAKQRLDLMMPDLAAWRIHDLRRTVRTGLSRLRVPPHIAELVLGHAVRGVQRVYDQYDYLDERREALTRWAEHLARVVGHEPSAQS